MNSKPQVVIGVSMAFLITLTVCYIFVKEYKADAPLLNLLAFIQGKEFDGWLLLLNNLLFATALLFFTHSLLHFRTQSNQTFCQPLALFAPDGLAIGEENKNRVAFLTDLLKDVAGIDQTVKKTIRNGELDINPAPSPSFEEQRQPQEQSLDPKQRLAEKLRREIKANRKN